LSVNTCLASFGQKTSFNNSSRNAHAVRGQRGSPKTNRLDVRSRRKQRTAPARRAGLSRHGNDGWGYHRWNFALTSGGDEAVAKLERFATAKDSAISRTICTANTTKIAGQLIRSYSGLKSSGLGIDASL
jgi:hypothetical protein